MRVFIKVGRGRAPDLCIYLGPAARAGLAATPLAHPALVTWDVFFSGFEDPDLFSLTERGPKWSPNCADDVPVRGARARRARLAEEHQLHNWDPILT